MLLDNKVAPYITIITLVCTGLFWLYTINGLPSRVDAVEKELAIMRNKLDRNDIKTDMILDTVKLLETHILHMHNRGDYAYNN